ncbi:MAG: glycoside hydrolase [bacterium]|nr:glycoside hydrolase [bacterium]
MIEVKKKTFAKHENGKTPMTSFVLYINEKNPVLLMRMFESIGNDVWDKNFDIISYDNGRTWGEKKLVLQRESVENGEMSYTEGAAIYCAKTNELVVITDYKFEPTRVSTSLDHPYKLHISRGSPENMAEAKFSVTDFVLKQGICLSFCHPFIDSEGRFIFPAMNPVIDRDNKLVSLGYKTIKGSKDIMRDYWEPRIIIGCMEKNNEISWCISDPVPFDFTKTARGLFEPTVVELKDGRFAMICRGSNGIWIEEKGQVVTVSHPGCKWVSYSKDRGKTWSYAEPLKDTDGNIPESSSTGSYLFRSTVNGKLYWIGNLCLPGEHPINNWPRHTLFIAEVEESSHLALKKDTLSIIDKKKPGESDQIQLSNFRCYQDRVTGEIVLFMNRFFERGGYENMAWHNTDLYEYRFIVE